MRAIVREKLKEYIIQEKDTGLQGFCPDKKKSNETVESKVDALRIISGQVAACRKCSLGLSRLNPCFGNGNPQARLMFVGEGPGYAEDHSGIVFIGRAGKLLDKLLLEETGLKRSDVYIANIVKCHPMKDPSSPHSKGNDRPPLPEETGECISYLVDQIRIIKPSLIVTLGSPSMKTMLVTESGITKLRGRVFEINIGGLTTKLMPTYHPAYILRNASKAPEIREDFRKIRELL